MKKILALSHGTIERNSGGVEIYQRLMKQELQNQVQFYFFGPDLHSKIKNAYLLYTLDNQLNFEFQRRYVLKNPVQQDHLNHTELEKIIEEILSEFKFDLAHVHHLLRLVPSLISLIKSKKIPVMVSIHDYYTICDQYQLLDVNGQFCKVFDQPTRSCDECLHQLRHIQHGSQAKRRHFYQNELQFADVFHFNTEQSKNWFFQIYPMLQSKLSVVWGAPSTTQFNPNFRKNIHEPKDRPISIIIPNGLSKIKGADVILEIIQSADPKKFNFHIFGKTDRPYSETKIGLKHSNVKFYGSYQQSDLQQIAPSMQLSLHLSIWPETYCISLSEMWDLGIIPIAAKIGALTERITHEKTGYLVPPHDAGEVIKILYHLHQYPEQIQQIRNQLTPDLTVNAAACAQRLFETYNGTITQSVNTGEYSFHHQNIDQSWILAVKRLSPLEKIKKKWRRIFN
jgi:glycosyltransferase involved in cell wall biosynthesis